MPLPDSEGFNVKFVQLVETHKCLYDASLLEYSVKEEQDKAWSQIAQKCLSTVPECKSRWKHLRGGLTRYVKKMREKNVHASKSVKQFYLWHVMQFVTPYLKSRDRSGRLPPKCFEDQEGEESDEIDEGGATNYDTTTTTTTTTDTNTTNDNNVDNVFKSCEIKGEASDTPLFDADHTVFYNKQGRKKRRTSTEDDSADRAVLDSDYVTEKPVQEPDCHDLQFFRSILPDLAELNASKKRRFKIRVLQLLEDLSNEVTSSSRHSTNSSAFSHKL